MGSLISMPHRQGETNWREHVSAVGVDARRNPGQPDVDRHQALALALRGGVALLFGLLALLWPGVTLLALALLFAAYLFVDGAAMMASAIARHPWREEPPWQYLLAGLAGVLVAFMTLLWPQITALKITALTFVMLAGAWAVVTGLLELTIAITGLLEVPGWRRPHRAMIGEPLFALAGMASVVAGTGIVILLRPDAEAVVLATVLGAYALIVGVVLLSSVSCSWLPHGTCGTPRRGEPGHAYHCAIRSENRAFRSGPSGAPGGSRTSCPGSPWARMQHTSHDTSHIARHIARRS